MSMKSYTFNKYTITLKKASKPWTFNDFFVQKDMIYGYDADCKPFVCNPTPGKTGAYSIFMPIDTDDKGLVWEHGQKFVSNSSSTPKDKALFKAIERITTGEKRKKMTSLEIETYREDKKIIGTKDFKKRYGFNLCPN